MKVSQLRMRHEAPYFRGSRLAIDRDCGAGNVSDSPASQNKSEQKANMLHFLVMREPDSHRRRTLEPATMTQDELAELRTSLSRLSLTAVRQAYHTAHSRCRMVNDHVPSARSIQELVQIWKDLWSRR